MEVLHLVGVSSEDKVDKHILKNLTYLSRIFHDNPRFLNCGNGFMFILNERGT